MNNKNISKNNKNQEQLYQQCLLRKRSGSFSVIDVAWIPVEYGVVGKCLKFWMVGENNENVNKNGKWDGDWSNSWVVLKTYGVRSENDIVKMTWDHRKWSEMKLG